MAWNREHARPQTAGATALDWAITAMRDTTGRLRRVRTGDQARVIAAISEAVWRVTIVDATLVRYHPAAYDHILAGQSPAERRQIERTLAGLRFVRNQMGLHLDPADFVCPAAGRPGGDEDRIAARTWKWLPEPPLGALPPSGQEWERTRYRAYLAQLAGHPVGETFGRAAAFLTRIGHRVGERGGLLSGLALIAVGITSASGVL